MSWYNLPSFANTQNTPAAPAPVLSTEDEQKKRDALAKALMNFGSDIPEQKMVGRIVQPISPMETLAKLGAAGYGAYKAGQKQVIKMADMNYLPYAQQNAEIERQRRLAELLQQQAYQPMETQIVGGRAIPISPWQTAAKLMQAGLGAYMQGKSEKSEAELKKQAREEAKKYFTDLATYAQKGEKTGETPITTEISGYGATQPLPVLNVQDGKFSQAMKDVYTPATKAGMLARMMEGMSSENPDVAKYASTFGTALMPKEVSATDLFNKLDLSKLTPESAEIVAATGDPTKARFKPEEMSAYQKAELDWKEKDAEVRRLEAARDNARSDAQLANSQAQLNLAIQARDQSRKEFEYNYPNLAGQYTPASVSAGQPPSGMTAPQPAGQQPVQQVTQPVSKPLSRQDQMAYNAKVEPLNDAAIKLANYRQALNEVSRSGSIAGAGAGQLKTAYSNALAAVRVLQNTGVYNPGEAFLLDKALRDASTISSIVDPTSRDQIIAQLEEQFKNLDAKKGVIDTQFQQAPTPLTVGVGKSKVGETAAQRAKRLGL